MNVTRMRETLAVLDAIGPSQLLPKHFTPSDVVSFLEKYKLEEGKGSMFLRLLLYLQSAGLHSKVHEILDDGGITVIATADSNGPQMLKAAAAAGATQSLHFRFPELQHVKPNEQAMSDVSTYDWQQWLYKLHRDTGLQMLIVDPLRDWVRHYCGYPEERTGSLTMPDWVLKDLVTRIALFRTSSSDTFNFLTMHRRDVFEGVPVYTTTACNADVEVGQPHSGCIIEGLRVHDSGDFWLVHSAKFGNGISLTTGFLRDNADRLNSKLTPSAALLSESHLLHMSSGEHMLTELVVAPMLAAAVRSFLKECEERGLLESSQSGNSADGK